MSIFEDLDKPRYRASECGEHGHFRDYRLIGDTWQGCPKCRDEEAQRKFWLMESGVHGRFAKATFDSFEAKTPAQRHVLAEMRAFTPKRSWEPRICLGGVGTGKSLLSSASVLTACESGTRARLITARGFVQAVRATWRKGSAATEVDILEEFARVPYLAVDDIGAGGDGDAVHILDLIDQRYRDRRPTLVTSNLNWAQLRDCLGDRCVDRLRENAVTLVFDWPSFRGSVPVSSGPDHQQEPPKAPVRGVCL